MHPETMAMQPLGLDREPLEGRKAQVRYMGTKTKVPRG